MSVARPTSVTIIGQTWQIIYVDEPEIALTDVDAVGRTFQEQLIILLSTKQALAQTRESLLHEITHGIFKMLRVHNDKLSAEQVANMIGVVMLDVLRSNPLVTQFLLDA